MKALAFGALAIAALLVCTPSSGQTLVNPFLAPDRSDLMRPDIPESALVGLLGTTEARNCPTADDWEEAARLARHRSAEFTAALEVFQRYPVTGAKLAAAGEEAYEAVALAVLASDPEQFAEAVRPECPDRSKIQEDAGSLKEELEEAERRLGPLQASLFASGSVRGLVSEEGGSDDASEGTGSLGLAVSFGAGGHYRVVTGLITVASSAQTISDGFSSGILNPGRGGAFQSGLLDVKWEGLRFWALPLPNHLYVAYARSNWRTDAAGGSEEIIAGDVNIFAAGWLASRHIARGRLFATPVALSIEAGPALRLVDGSGTVLETALASDRTAYWLLESGMSVTFGPATAAISGYWAGGGAEDGISGFLVAAGMSVEAPFIAGALLP